MADPFVAEIRIFAFNFPPRGWAFCSGQLLPLSQNTALFSLLGTTYGGNGKTNFGLPNIEGRALMQAGQGPGLSLRDLGEELGVASVSLIEAQLPAHRHTVNVGATPANLAAPALDRVASRTSGGFGYQTNTSGNLAAMSPSALAPLGGSLPHNNYMPSLVMNFCIALQGVFPPRS